MIAANAGPKRAGSPMSGDTDTSGITGHVIPYARTKNEISGCRSTIARVFLMAVTSLRLHRYRDDHEADEGCGRSQSPDHAGAAVPLSLLRPGLRAGNDLP